MSWFQVPALKHYKTMKTMHKPIFQQIKKLIYYYFHTEYTEKM